MGISRIHIPHILDTNDRVISGADALSFLNLPSRRQKITLLTLFFIERQIGCDENTTV